MIHLRRHQTTWRLIVGLLSVVLMASANALEPHQPAPEISAKSASGTAVTIAAHRGQIIYLDFWASWCGPCRQSFPWMNAMQAKYGVKGLQVLAVNLDTKEADARQFLLEHPAQFGVAFDSTGVTPRSYGIKGMPTSYLIDRQGRILMEHSGFTSSSKDALERAIREALEEK